MNALTRFPLSPPSTAAALLVPLLRIQLYRRREAREYKNEISNSNLRGSNYVQNPYMVYKEGLNIFLTSFSLH